MCAFVFITWSVVKNFANKPHLVRHISFRVFIHWSMAYWSTDQNSVSLEVEDRKSLTLFIRWYSYKKSNLCQRLWILILRKKYWQEYGSLKKRRNNICLIPLLDACSFSRWCTFLTMFEILASILINNNCLLQPIKMRKTWFLPNKNLLLKVIVRTIFLWESKVKVCFDYIILMCT